MRYMEKMRRNKWFIVVSYDQAVFYSVIFSLSLHTTKHYIPFRVTANDSQSSIVNILLRNSKYVDVCTSKCSEIMTKFQILNISSREKFQTIRDFFFHSHFQVQLFWNFLREISDFFSHHLKI